MRCLLAITALATWLAFASSPVLAHGFGQRYDLPIPLSMYIWGAAATVGLSFVLAGLFLRRSKERDGYPSFDLFRIPPVRWLAHPVIVEGVRAIAVALFLLIVAAGYIGDQNPFKNIAPTMIWVIWWVGMAYISSLVGNLWALINPIAALFYWAEAAWDRAVGRELSRNLPWRETWGVWPAVLLFLAFAWCELVWGGADRPMSLSIAITLYAAISWLGMFLFGRQTWVAQGDAFALVFGLFARFSPTAARVRDGRPTFELRPYAVGLLVRRPVPPSLVFLALLVLATVSFDGFAETSGWAAVVQWVLTESPLAGYFFDLQIQKVAPIPIITTAALILIPCLFFVVFLVFCQLMALGARMAQDIDSSPRSGPPLIELAGLFVLTLVPIAVAYHLAHYLSYLAIAGQYAIPLASDPFGLGWNLFGTKLYFIDISVINARLVWYVSVSAIVLAHVIAVYLAHRMALRIYPTSRAAIASQVPMVVLMICYTMISLWIIAQPIVSD